MVNAPTVALAVILVSMKKPSLEGNRLIIWRDVRDILRKYRIKHKYYVCQFTYTRMRIEPEKERTVERRIRYSLIRRKLEASREEKWREVVEYRRLKVVVNDKRYVKKAFELASNPERTKVVFARYFNVVKEVLLSLRYISVRAKNYFYVKTLRKIFEVYRRFKTRIGMLIDPPYLNHINRLIVREILPNWRGSRYKLLKRFRSIAFRKPRWYW